MPISPCPRGCRCRQSAGRPCSPKDPEERGLQRLVDLFREWSVVAGGPTTTSVFVMPTRSWPVDDERARPESPYTHTHIQSCPPRRRLLDRSTCSGCTTRRCRVNASFLLNVFSSVHSGQCTFCLRALCIVSSCRVRS
jgi:hypothetical protein